MVDAVEGLFKVNVVNVEMNSTPATALLLSKL